MPGDSFITFAYGSNMPTARIRARCPSAVAMGVAELRGYELRWHKISNDGSGKPAMSAKVQPQRAATS